MNSRQRSANLPFSLSCYPRSVLMITFNTPPISCNPTFHCRYPSCWLHSSRLQTAKRLLLTKQQQFPPCPSSVPTNNEANKSIRQPTAVLLQVLGLGLLSLPLLEILLGLRLIGSSYPWSFQGHSKIYPPRRSIRRSLLARLGSLPQASVKSALDTQDHKALDDPLKYLDKTLLNPHGMPTTCVWEPTITRKCVAITYLQDLAAAGIHSVSS